MFKRQVKGKNLKCGSREEYAIMKNELENFGIAKFCWDMENLNVFKNGKIDETNNSFAKLILKTKSFDIEKERDFTKRDDFIMITSIENSNHKLLIPKTFDWQIFNVLTLTKEHIPMLETMKKIALSYVENVKFDKYLLCFHCYPFNSVYTLHLHIVNPNLEKSFIEKNNNLPIDDVLDYLYDS